MGAEQACCMASLSTCWEEGFGQDGTGDRTACCDQPSACLLLSVGVVLYLYHLQLPYFVAGLEEFSLRLPCFVVYARAYSLTLLPAGGKRFHILPRHVDFWI